jgi:uncharacterized protein with HEPN domain
MQNNHREYNLKKQIKWDDFRERRDKAIKAFMAAKKKCIWAKHINKMVLRSKNIRFTV